MQQVNRYKKVKYLHLLNKLVTNVKITIQKEGE